MREITYVQAINETLHQLLESDSKVVLIGQGVNSPWYVGHTTVGLYDKYPNRVIDTPVSENSCTGMAIGCALAGMKPIVVYPRMDFMYLAFDQIINQAANWFEMFGRQSAPSIVFWGIINRGNAQAAQHSQSIHGLFNHIPGLKVFMPSNPSDAKGLLVEAVDDGGPVVYVDDRWNYEIKGDVPTGLFNNKQKSYVVKEGRKLTIVSSSWLVNEALSLDIDAEVIDLCCVKPLDLNTIEQSVKKTGKCLIVDGGYKTGGLAESIGFKVSKFCSRVEILALPDLPAPACDDNYFIGRKDILAAAQILL